VISYLNPHSQYLRKKRVFSISPWSWLQDLSGLPLFSQLLLERARWGKLREGVLRWCTTCYQVWSFSATPHRNQHMVLESRETPERFMSKQIYIFLHPMCLASHERICHSSCLNFTYSKLLYHCDGSWNEKHSSFSEHSLQELMVGWWNSRHSTLNLSLSYPAFVLYFSNSSCIATTNCSWTSFICKPIHTAL
jgi:hypothetical protein